MNIYEKSCRLKLRWKTTKGNLTVEDLFDLSLQSLDRVGNTCLQERRMKEDSFIQLTPEKQQSELDLKIEIVRAIIAEKQRNTKPVYNADARTTEEIL